MKTRSRTVVGWIFLTLAGHVSAAVAVYQDGGNDPFTGLAYSGAEDAFLTNRNDEQKNQNFGARTQFYVRDHSAVTENTVMRFDVTSLAGEYETINSVVLRVYLGAVPPDDGTVSLSLLVAANQGWVEGAGVASDVSNYFPGTVTWNEIQRGTQTGAGAPNGSGEEWAGGNTGGGAAADQDATVATVTISGTELAGSYIDFVFTDTAFMKNWVSGDNPGFVLTSNGIDAGSLVINSSEAADQGVRPELRIDYDPIPEPIPGILGGLAWMLLLFRRRR